MSNSSLTLIFVVSNLEQYELKQVRHDLDFNLYKRIYKYPLKKSDWLTLTKYSLNFLLYFFFLLELGLFIHFFIYFLCFFCFLFLACSRRFFFRKKKIPLFFPCNYLSFSTFTSLVFFLFCFLFMLYIPNVQGFFNVTIFTFICFVWLNTILAAKFYTSIRLFF